MMFADDTQLNVFVNPVEDRSVVVSKLETCVMDIFYWCTKNGLTCNPDKTEVIHLSRFARNCELIPELRFGEVVITLPSAVRDLGVTLDPHLQLSKHVNNVCKSGFSALKNIGRIRNYVRQSNFKA